MPPVARIPDRELSDLLREQYRDPRNLDARFALHQRFTTNRQPFHRWVLDQFALPDGARVLELGCGFGKLWTENRERIRAGWRLMLSDLSDGMLEACRRNLDAITRRFSMVRCDAPSIPFRAGSFDAVIANHMLYHVIDLPRTLSEIRRVLGAGGVFYAATNGKPHMREVDDMMARFFPDAERDRSADRFGLENGPAHLRPYFEQIVLRRYETALLVTEAEPLVAYIRSFKELMGRPEQAFVGLRAHIENELSRNGHISITNDTGMFIARG